MPDRTPSERVVQTVAETTARDPLELPPLFESIESDALDALIRGMEGGTVTFCYAGRSITVDSGGSVTIDGRPTDRHTGEEAASGD